MRSSGLDVLAINTYGGSLLVAASRYGLPIRGSYEDVGYGTPVQRENYPHLNTVEKRADWPNDLLKETIVLAHPPCSAFSNMNNSAKTKGVDSGAFSCTKGVLDYAMHSLAPAIAVESVVGAYEGARSIHDSFARHYGYHVYRLLENSATYGVPQWRNRFWCLFVKKGLLRNDVLQVAHTQQFSAIKDILLKDGYGTQVGQLEMQWGKLREKLLESQSRGDAADILRGGFGYGCVPDIANREWHGKKLKSRKSMAMKYHWDGGGFACFWLKLLDPKGYAPTLLGSSWWGCQGRSLYEEEYKRCMGFPDQYKFPGKHLKKFREYLSKGVCPPVAEHVLSTLHDNLTGSEPEGYLKFELKPGETCDLRIKKGDWPWAVSTKSLSSTPRLLAST